MTRMIEKNIFYLLSQIYKGYLIIRKIIINNSLYVKQINYKFEIENIPKYKVFL